jgi:hypothetical protein
VRQFCTTSSFFVFHPLSEAMPLTQAKVSSTFAMHRMVLAMETVVFYRRRAAECLALATTATDPEHKRLFVDMAASWHDLAALAAHSEEAALRPITPTNLSALDESDERKESVSTAVRRKLTLLLFSPPERLKAVNK